MEAGEIDDAVHRVLKQYWGYTAFRPLQEEIIRSVMAGKDTLALMPTGGGKSITYQVPGLLGEGLCLVVTPLIALMKDQVEDLKGRGIAAEAIYTGIEPDEVESIINKCIYTRIFFLYLSPERLASDYFRVKLKQMPVSMIAVDEAHCISQWGYDFRPSYLRIAEIRTYFPTAPVLALTATATPEVVKDIQERLGFREMHVLSKSFRRENIAYVVREREDKFGELLHILQRTPGSGIVYVRKRKQAEELAASLNKAGILSDFYHAGLSALKRASRQEDWKSGRIPVIVATNAFGMGIDKAEVRVVIHYDIPDSPEAYFQEAGRAGRDGLRAYAVLLYNRAALAALKKRIEKSFPEKESVRTVYDALGNHFQIPEGGGAGMVFEFNAEKFASDFDLDQYLVNASIDILGVAGYMECTTAINSRSRIQIRVLRDQLYRIELGDPFFDRLLIILMRYYAGIFVQEVFVDETFICAELGTDAHTLYEALLNLSRRKIIRYIPGNDTPYILYLQPRYPSSYLVLDKSVYEDRKKSYAGKVNAMAGYIETERQCRQLFLLSYFGQEEKEPCGICDLCTGRKKLKKRERLLIRENILKQLSQHPVEIRDLVHSMEYEPEEVIDQIRRLLDEEQIRHLSHTLLSLNGDGGE